MTDIVDRLSRQYNEWNNPPSPELPEGAGILLEAKAEVERLRAALREIRDEIIYGGGDMIEEPDIDKLHDIASTALEGKDD